MKPLDRGEVGAGRLLALQRLEGGCSKCVIDGAEPIGSFGVAVAGVV
jgi:hypothetical protein